MNINIKRRHRRSVRLPEYDYSTSGAYFVTICSQDRECIFGEIKNGKIQLNNIGQIIDVWWRKIFDKYENLSMNEYIIMPNHVHGIINIVGAIPCNRPNGNIKNEINMNYGGENIVSPLQMINTYNGLGQYISWFKRMSTTEYIRHVKNDNWPMFNRRLWQRNYYEHIIRNNNDLNRIRKYIIDNPIKWQEDKYNPMNKTPM